jgi:hypothetical protein
LFSSTLKKVLFSFQNFSLEKVSQATPWARCRFYFILFENHDGLRL